MPEIAAALEILKSKNIGAEALEKGLSLYRGSRVHARGRADEGYSACVDDDGETCTAVVSFSSDGRDLDSWSCHCDLMGSGSVCGHVAAVVFAVRGEAGETKPAHGKTAKAGVSVTEQNTARAVGSGSLDVFATPMMIALMERAACAALADSLEEGQTSVGVSISVSHSAASPVGARVTAEATVTSVSGRSIEFEVSASDENGDIGRGTHTRVIVDSGRFMKKAEAARGGQSG